jgi:hypothetical protein
LWSIAPNAAPRSLGVIEQASLRRVIGETPSKDITLAVTLEQQGGPPTGAPQGPLVFKGTLADCIRELLAKPVKGISLYDIVIDPQPAFDKHVLSPGDAAEIAMRQDFPKV